ncbi:DEAD/DEAH box helicase [PVC group bacterium]|nr:DEAD/DEAH box helicase [PVC group bacterium]
MFPDQIAIVPRIVLQKKGAIDWFKFDVKYEAGKSTPEISKEAIHNALVCDKRYLRAKNGQYYPLDRKKIENLHSVIQDIHTDKSGRTSLWHLPFLVSEIGRDPSIQLTMDPELEKIWGEIKNFRGIEKKTLPKEVNRVLRDYQKKGLDWLCFLRSFGFSGILADDMGLGKTLQVLSLLAKKKKNSGPSLVVCPTSLVWNWFEEIQKFLPSLKAVIIHGPSRHEQFEKIPRMDLAITSYALVKKDLDRHLQHHYRYVVLDEAQMIKNQDSLVAKAVKKLNARYRLALSGTPIENNLMELWSIFDFLMKGYLLSESAFRKKYERPITKDGCPETLKRLRRKIYPFVLRRVKEDVLDELPDKIEQTIHSELSPVQIQIYKKILKHYRSQIVETVHRRGFERSRITILTALLRLRQICCHPGLVDPALIDHNMHDDISGKFDALRDIVRKILQNKQKVLVFSQFTKMLDIMEEWIQKEGIMYTRLDGHTKNRQEVVQRFVDHVPSGVFLMSLKAGGLGLNLECANHVILYDPWWNPAVEEQAIDRAHRMGQKTVVHAYRLISLGTIEEKVRALQKKKEDLFDCVIKTNQDMVRSLSWEDVKLLFDL